MRPSGALARTGLLLPSLNMRTDSDPMRALLAEARAIEARPGVLDVSVFGGYQLTDAAGDAEDFYGGGLSNRANIGLRYRF